MQMQNLKNLALVERPHLKHSPAEFADTTFQALSDKIASDYTDIIRKLVLPMLPGEHALKIRELRVLTCIDFYDIPITPAHIADMLRYDPATVTRAISILEKAHLIQREKNGFDQRSVTLATTDLGTILADHYKNSVKTVFAKLEDRLTYGLTDEEKTSYLTIMVKVSRRAEIMRKMALGKPF